MQTYIRHTKHDTNIHTAERVLSVLSGGALVARGIRQKSAAGVLLALAGAGIVKRGVTGHCQLYEALGVRTNETGRGDRISVPYELGVRIDRSVVIQRPREEVYKFFRNLSNLPRVMRHVERVDEMEGKRSHWKVKAPGGHSVEWDAVIHNEEENELIAWRSLPGADVDSAGSVWFKPAQDDGATEVRVELQYNPPAGAVGAKLAEWIGVDPDRQMREDLENLKFVLEAHAPVNVG